VPWLDSPKTLGLPDLRALCKHTSANGLVIDGGVVVLSHSGTGLRRCLVMALPLGLVRLGRYDADPAGPLSATQCQSER